METKKTQPKYLSPAELRQHQKVCVKALEKFDEICKAKNIPFYLLGGSVLGGVRHKGFIPWDDDIDIAILNSDRDALEKALLEELGDGFEFVSERTNERYPRLHGKILHNKRGCIDIFPMARIFDNNLLASLQWAMHKLLMKVFYKRIGYSVVDGNPVFGMIANLLAKILDRKKILALIEKNYNLCKRSNRWINFNSIYSMKTEMFDSEDVIDKEYIVFEKKKYRTFAHAKDYLRRAYGDYRKLPPKEKRVCPHLELFEDM